ncbi:MAG: leishmanolysin-related zinc metalloendopeptidase, partial [Gemmatimonadales bacterium]
DNQFALAGTAVPSSPVAKVRDQFNNGVSGIPVTFTIGLGAGDVASTPVATDATGNAAAPSWKLGKSAEAQSLRASAGGFAATVMGVVQSDYNIDVRFFGPPMTPIVATAFTAAAGRIRGAVIGDVLDTTMPTAPISLESCGITGVTTFQESVDDVIIYAAVAPIDGPGRVLAFAGPCLIRGPATQSNRQTVVGVMKFDAADLDTLIARGTLTDVIQHEMFHVVGLGTLWNTYRVIAGAGTLDSRFTGTLGVGACVAIGGAPICPGSVPVENSGGSGTADGHWRESVFATELMTGFVSRPTPGFTGILNPLSTITIQSFADIGYVVNPSGADPYTIPGFGLSAIRAQMNVDNSSEWEQLIRPQMELSRLGGVSAIRNQ